MSIDDGLTIDCESEKFNFNSDISFDDRDLINSFACSIETDDTSTNEVSNGSSK